MALVCTSKATMTLEYWQLSLAWKNMGNWAKGLTYQDFSDRVKEICNDNGRLGFLADSLLYDAVCDIERRPLKESGQVVKLPLYSKTTNIGLVNESHQAIG